MERRILILANKYMGTAPPAHEGAETDTGHLIQPYLFRSKELNLTSWRFSPSSNLNPPVQSIREVFQKTCNLQFWLGGLVNSVTHDKGKKKNEIENRALRGPKNTENSLKRGVIGKW